MPTFSNTPRPAYVYEAATDQWIPVGFGPHTHAVTDVTNAFNTTTVTTKGDLVVAAGSNNITRLAAGANGESLVADSSTTTGLRWQGSQAAGKNYFINGSMDIWQRGTSFTTPGGAYTADRFKVTVNGAGTYVVSRQASGLSETQYCLRFQRSAGQTYTHGSFVGYAWETEAMQSLQGKTVTYSFYARVGANWSPLGGVGVQLQQGTGSGTHAFSALTGESTAFASTASGLTTSWQRFSFTGALSSTATELRTNISFSPVGTAGVNDYIELTGFQLELGSVATPLSRAGGTFAGELAACQRYYTTSIPTGFTVTDFSGMNPGSSSAIGWCSPGSSNDIFTTIQYPVPMRTTPTFVIYSAGNRTVGSVRDAVTGSDIAVSNYSVQTGNNKGFNYMAGFTATTGRPYSFQWTASAEL